MVKTAQSQHIYGKERPIRPGRLWKPVARRGCRRWTEVRILYKESAISLEELTQNLITLGSSRNVEDHVEEKTRIIRNYRVDGLFARTNWGVIMEGT